ncbi:MAG: hypothetical protein U0996_25750 [Planctomycetaceae bacterium]
MAKKKPASKKPTTKSSTKKVAKKAAKKSPHVKKATKKALKRSQSTRGITGSPLTGTVTSVKAKLGFAFISYAPQKKVQGSAEDFLPTSSFPPDIGATVRFEMDVDDPGKAVRIVVIG